jgi:hypothetical protein
MQKKLLRALSNSSTDAPFRTFSAPKARRMAIYVCLCYDNRQQGNASTLAGRAALPAIALIY